MCVLVCEFQHFLFLVPSSIGLVHGQNIYHTLNKDIFLFISDILYIHHMQFDVQIWVGGSIPTVFIADTKSYFDN